MNESERRQRMVNDGAWPGSARVALLVFAMSILAASTAGAQYVNFEAGHVRPLALGPGGNLLFAANTPDNQLTILRPSSSGVDVVKEVQVGLRPVAVAVRDLGGGLLEVWVVNHLSDSVSIVSVDSANLSGSRVTRTLIVGDEPRDIVFAGAGDSHAYITTARRGQHDTVPAAHLKTSGLSRALVWVFSATATGAGIGGAPVNIIELFTDTPRGLAVSPDGTKVYAAGHRSGNQTTVLGESVVNGGMPPMPPGATAGWPETGVIVKLDPVSRNWEDESATNWSSSVGYDLPDKDVFIIDATASPPALAGGTNFVSGVGTVLFNVAVRPDNGKVYVSNQEMRNHVRFENVVDGPARPGLQGHVAESRITVIDGTTGSPVHLNSHIDYEVGAGSQSERDQSLSMPLDMVFDSAGGKVYVAAFGSSKVAVLNTNDLEGGTISSDRIPVPGGPSGLALDEARDRLYVMSRFDNAVSVIEHPGDVGTRTSLAGAVLHTPEPPEVLDGRRFLYDANFASAHGDASCGTCHIFGDMDKLAWDLGDPNGSIEPNPNTDILDLLFGFGQGLDDFHPLKGPMTTQSLRGLNGQGPMHWRGDKTNITDEFDDVTNFSMFSGAFVSLLGRGSEPTPAEFADFSAFVLTLRYPPNPIRALDDSLSPSEARGMDVFDNVPTAGGAIACGPCHTLPTGTNGTTLEVNGIADVGNQGMKIPHLRNMYDKVGAYDVAGDQVSGFGFLHDGSDMSMEDFLNIGAFQFTGTQETDVNDFQMAVDTGSKPVVGQQVSVLSGNYADGAIIDRIDLFMTQADAGNADLVVKGVVATEPRGAVYVGGGQFQTDKSGEPNLTASEIRTLASTLGQEQVFTAVPVGTGTRIGINRDNDTLLDGNDNCPGVVNDAQTDTDSDGLGDPCDPTPVPEPGVIAMLAAGLPMLGWMHRRRSRRCAA
jgi:DNA-binding beta-propeller fold protein YncE